MIFFDAGLLQVSARRHDSQRVATREDLFNGGALAGVQDSQSAFGRFGQFVDSRSVGSGLLRCSRFLGSVLRKDITTKFLCRQLITNRLAAKELGDEVRLPENKPRSYRTGYRIKIEIALYKLYKKMTGRDGLPGGSVFKNSHRFYHLLSI
jgi:hypothetical protein